MFLLKLLTRPNNVKRNMDKSSVYFATKSDETLKLKKLLPIC